MEQLELGLKTQKSTPKQSESDGWVHLACRGAREMAKLETPTGEMYGGGGAKSLS